MSSGVLQGGFWLLSGAAIFYASWSMDRLEKVGVQPFSAPGLLPGILGLFLMVLGGIMLVREVRSGRSGAAAEPIEWRRVAVPIVLCLAYAAGLVGRVPFWLASWIFVAAMIWTLQYRERRQRGELRRLALAAPLIGLGTGVVVSLIFQQLFLIRLP